MPRGAPSTHLGGRVARPHHGPVTRVERVQDSCSTERVDATVAECRRCARAGASVRLPEPSRVAVPPHGFAGLQAVGRYDLAISALLLGKKAIAGNGKR